MVSQDPGHFSPRDSALFMTLLRNLKIAEAEVMAARRLEEHKWPGAGDHSHSRLPSQASGAVWTHCPSLPESLTERKECPFERNAANCGSGPLNSLGSLGLVETGWDRSDFSDKENKGEIVLLPRSAWGCPAGLWPAFEPCNLEPRFLPIFPGPRVPATK